LAGGSFSEDNLGVGEKGHSGMIKGMGEAHGQDVREGKPSSIQAGPWEF